MKERSPSSRLVVLSLDGMRPDLYRRAAEFGIKMRHTMRLAEKGASADAVESIYPSTTYPAHTTLVTGVPPRVHGIYSHLASLDPTEKSRPWCWFAPAIRVPTLWDVSRATGRKTAAISWPVSAGSSIHYNIPEIWNPSAPDPHRDFDTAARHSTPGLFAEVSKVLHPILATATPDRLRCEAALHVWKHYRPDLLLVHFVYYDQLAHRFGPESQQALKALEQADEEVGRISEVVLGDDHPTLVVLSDHGFLSVDKEAAPLVILAEEGLLGRESNGTLKVERLGAIHAGGSFAIYWLEEPTSQDQSALQKAVERLRATGAIAQVLDRDELESLEADPDAELMLEAAPGYYFSDRLDGPAVRASVKDRGTHGHLPSTPGLEASFIAVGPKITPGKKLGRMSLTQVAPTLARELGLPADILATKEKPVEFL